MRIRKNANKSSFMSSHASGLEPLQTHVCQLNQSPWDVISFSQEACPSSLHLQFEGEDSFNGNGSFGDSMGVVESSASMMVDAEERAAIKMKIDNMSIDDNYETKGNPEKKGMLDEYYSERKVLKKCKNESKQGSSMRDRGGLNLSAGNHVTACLGPASSQSVKKPEKAATGTRRSRAKSTRKGIPSNPNPYEFYYYSGFGPLWGKRRGDRGEGIKGREGKETETTRFAAAAASSYDTTPPFIPPPVGHNDNSNDDGFDYLDEEDDDEEEEGSGNGDSSKKRLRKPVKARSLKSLM